MTTTSANAALHAWVGTPPANWRKDWLKWSVSLSTERPTDDEMERLPYIANEDITSWTGKLLNPDPQPVEADSRRFRRDDVLFNKLRPYLAKVYHAEFDGLSSGELLCLRHSPSVLARFLFYVVSSKAFVDAVNAETFGSKMPRADWEIVGHQPLPLPPLDTQKRIAAFLDEKTAQIDALIAKKQALLERLAEKRQAIITQAVTKGLNPAASMKPSGIDWLGDIPAHWEVRRIKELGTLIGGAGFPHEFQGFTDLEFPFFKVMDLGAVKQNERMLETSNTIDREMAKQLRAAILQARDIVFAKVGAALLLNRFREIGVPSCIDNNMMAFRPNELIDGGFALQALSRIRFADIVNPGAVPSINGKQIGELVLAVPPRPEQRTISEVVRERSDALEQAEQQATQSAELLVEYRSALITAAVTGQIKGLR